MTNNTSKLKFCQACVEGTIHKVLYEKNGCRIQRCSVCGLGDADSTDFDPDTYYTQDYFDGNHSDGYSDYKGSEQVLRIEFGRLVNVLKQYCPPGSRILEIGCAYGFFLKEARESFDVHGIELCKDAVSACRRDGLDGVHLGAVNRDSLKKVGQVDAIIMLDVIEHLPDPFEALRQCCEILKLGGVILITTGDFGSLTARISGSHWRLMTPPQHLWFFSRASFDRIASSLGLSVAAYSKPWKFVPISLVLFQIARILGFRWQPSLAWLSRKGIPVNVYDTMRIIIKKPNGRG